MRPGNWEDFVEFDKKGAPLRDSAVSYASKFDSLNGLIDGTSPISTHTAGTVGSADVTIGGALDDTELWDTSLVFNLTAGVTYTFAQRPGGADPLEDPYLLLYSVAAGEFVAEDDDGGLGRSSMITFTPSENGFYVLVASSWWHLATADENGENFIPDPGTDYTIDRWEADPANDVGHTPAEAVEIGVGTTYGHLEEPGDRDLYTFEVSEGQVGQFFSFTYAGGISGGDDWEDPTTPGENIGIVRILNSAGQQIAAAVNYETGVGFLPEEAGTYYVRVEPYEPDMTGGYTLDLEVIDPASRDPLESLNWDSADSIVPVDVGGVPTVYVYFAPAGENFGELEPDGETEMATYGWEQHQIDAVMHALNTQYTPITGFNYVITDDPENATFRMLTTINTAYGARFYPQDPDYGDQAGIGTFNLISGGFGTDPASLLPGGYSYAVILHEFGHAHGVAHPHDTGGGSEVMLGVTASTGSLGIYDLNQGVYTVMSYNDGWQTHPDGTLEYSRQTRDNGWSETLSAFDIAVLQQRYGPHDHNDGDTVYDLTQQQKVASYSTIWDSGGTDTIAFKGGQDVHIDLLAATLDYTPTGGGVVSYVSGTFGGYTIANGVVIENATGGSGNDLLLGNSANNVLTGNNGHDALIGREGDDTLLGGNGKDDLRGSEGNDTLNGGAGRDVLNGGAGDDMLIGGADDDLFVFDSAGTDTIVDYESGEDIDLSALGVTMDDVDVQADRIVVELGDDDLTIMFNTAGFSTDDLIFGDTSSSLASSSLSAGAGDYLFA